MHGLGLLYAPTGALAVRYIGTAPAIRDKRQAVLNAAYAANQRHFTLRPKASEVPGAAWINKPATTEPDLTQYPSKEAA